MKYILRPLLFLCLPLFLSACVEQESDPEPSEPYCIETKQADERGGAIAQIYNGDRITELQYLQNDEVLDYYVFNYGSNGRINESQYFNMQNGSSQVPDMITYHSNGKWKEVKGTNTTGTVYSYEAEYDSQNQIIKYTAKMNQGGNVTVRYTIDYEWTGGNNTLRTYTSATQRTVTRYEFDLERENKRRDIQETIAFLSSSVNFNKNMRLRTLFSSTILATGITTETATAYEYNYNDEGYPAEVVVTTSGATAVPTVSTTTFEYFCY